MKPVSLLKFCPIILVLPFAYEFTFFTLNSLITNCKLDVAIFWITVSILLATVYIYTEKYIQLNKFFKLFFLSFVLRIFLDPFFMFLKMKLGFVILCKRIVPPSEEKILIGLLVDISYFILLILILRFKKKDIFISALLAFVAMVIGIFLPHHFFVVN